MNRAKSSLPVPLSPVIKTLARLEAMFSAIVSKR
jgi:hypothetical protein